MIYLSGPMTYTFYDVIILLQGHDLKFLMFFYHVLYDSFLKLDVQNSFLPLCMLVFFFKTNFFKKKILEHYQSVKQFESRVGLIFC